MQQGSLAAQTWGDCWWKCSKRLLLNSAVLCDICNLGQLAQPRHSAGIGAFLSCLIDVELPPVRRAADGPESDTVWPAVQASGTACPAWQRSTLGPSRQPTWQHSARSRPQPASRLHWLVIRHLSLTWGPICCRQSQTATGALRCLRICRFAATVRARLQTQGKEWPAAPLLSSRGLPVSLSRPKQAGRQAGRQTSKQAGTHHCACRAAAFFKAEAVELLLQLARSSPQTCLPPLAAAGAVRELFLNNLKGGRPSGEGLAARQLLVLLARQVRTPACLLDNCSCSLP